MRFARPSSAMPASSVQEWLDHELETRGIDAVIYTRYILGILQQDSFQFEPQERELFPPAGSKKRDPCLGKGKGPKSKQKVNARMKFADSEEMKKSAAVECLLSASEQTCGIEELVDELCSRLKSIQCEGYTNEPGSNAVDVEGTGQVKDTNVVQSSPEELAKKYYAAFPALSGQLHMRDDLPGFPSYSMHYNTFWDGKKLLSTAGDVVVKDSESISLRKLDGGEPEEAAPDPTAAVKAAPEPKPAKPLSKVAHVHHTHHHHHHQHQHHNHHNHHHAKAVRFGREQVGGKPSFIVPKCKYRMLKQRVPFFKGKSPFSAPELKLKRFVLSDSKPNSRSPSERYFRSKKFDDFEIGYDSSFEDGDAEEAQGPPEREVKVEDAEPDGQEPAREPESAEDEVRGQNPEDVEILHNLEAKFNEGLASIWSERDTGAAPMDRLSQMLETAFKTSLSTWLTQLKRCEEGDAEEEAFVVDLRAPGEVMAAMDFYLDATSAQESPSGQQLLLRNFGNLWERVAADSTADWGRDDALQRCLEPSRIWQCGSRKQQNFIKGGVYGFQEEPSEPGTLSEMDLCKIGKATPASGSPAFDSDSEGFAEDGRGPNAIGEDELKIIWEILGAIGGRDSEASQNDDRGESPSFGRKDQPEDSIWEPLERYGLWDGGRRTSASAARWGCFRPDAEEEPPSLGELSLLWSGSFGVPSEEACASGISASFCWGGAEPRHSHRGFWDIWKDEDRDGGVSILEALVACSTAGGAGAVHDEHLSMTRSYDSYLNKGASEDGPPRQTRDQLLRRSDPVLFGRESTLTYHKGESLFVEVKQRRRGSSATPRVMDEGSSTPEAGDASEPPLLQEAYEEENLLTSPKTHFRPIRPLSRDSDDSGSSVEAVAEEDAIVGLSPPPGKPIFTRDEDGILHLSSEDAHGDSCQLYMPYKGQEASGKRPEEAVSAFVPKFKLRPDLEKFCQTEDVEAARGGEAKSRRQEGLGHLYRMSSAFEDLAEEGCADPGSCAEPEYSFARLVKGLGCIAGFRPSELDALGPRKSSLWSAGDDGGGTNGGDSSWPTSSEYSCAKDAADEQDSWATSEREEDAGGLMSMKEEIKQEEEELFEDINQMRELDLHGEWTEGYSPAGGQHNTDEGRGEGLEWPSPDGLYQEVVLECQEDEDCPELEMINGRQCELRSSWDPELDEDDGCALDEDEAAEEGQSVCPELKSFKAQDAPDPGSGKHHLSMIPTGKVVYSSDLEEEWMKHGKPFDIQVPKRHFLKAKLRSQRRPCTFYMDGNCRRTDCKFSHDLASITCRFWEEGSCFKGITCPFLHGYPRKHSPLHASGKMKDFHLESESDFPSLSKSADSTSSGSWMASAFSVKRKRKRNRPRHHSSSTMESDGAKCKIVESDKA